MEQSDRRRLDPRQRWVRNALLLALLALGVFGQVVLFNRRMVSPTMGWILYGAGLILVLVLIGIYRRSLSPAQKEEQRTSYYNRLVRFIPIRYALIAALALIPLVTAVSHRNLVFIGWSVAFLVVMALLLAWERWWAARQLDRRRNRP